MLQLRNNTELYEHREQGRCVKHHIRRYYRLTEVNVTGVYEADEIVHHFKIEF